MGPRMAPVIQSYKQVRTDAPASRLANTSIPTVLVKGVDNYAGPTAAFNEVPTGAIVKYIDIQHSCSNLVSNNQFFWITIQHTHSTQNTIDERTVGGDPQRNQVFMQKLFMLGKDQNSNRNYRFKIPKKFQRVRESDEWVFTRQSDKVFTDTLLTIYKFYR